MKKNSLKNYLKTGILLFGISLLILNSCEKEGFSDVTIQETDSFKLKTVSLEDAKNFFQTVQKNQQLAKGGKNTLVVTPDWNTLKYKSLFYTDELLTTVDVTINRKGKFITKILFINVNGEIRSVIYTLYIDSKTKRGMLKSARVYLTELNGDYIDGYGFENGLITTRFLPKRESNEVSSKNSAAKYAYPTTFWGDNESNESGTAGEVCSECVQLEEVVIYGYLYEDDSNTDWSATSANSPVNEYTYVENDNIGNVGGSVSTSTIEEVTTAVVIDPVIECDPGYILISGKCVEDTESPDQIIIDSSVTDCVKNIIDVLKIKDNHSSVVPSITDQPVSHISQAILDLFDSSTKYNLNFSIEQLGTDASGNEINGQTTVLASDFTSWSIKIDSDLTSNGTQLFIAKTIIHESIHAIIGYSLKEYRGSDFASDLQKLYSENDNNQNLTEHEFMSGYVEAFSYSLAAWDNHLQSQEYYKMLSWGGLEASQAYKDLDSSTKTKIQNTIQNERYNKNDAKGTKCN